MKKALSRALLLITFLAVAIGAQAQASSREKIRNSIKEWGECKTVALTKSNGNVAIYGNNGYSYSQIPTSLANAIKELNTNKETIKDVVLTDNGRWVVLYGDNGARWNNIPSDLERKIIEYNDNNETITSVALNSGGEWALVSTEHISASSESIRDWLSEGCEKYDLLWTVCMSDDGAIAVYDKGYRYLGSVPQDLKDALGETDLDVYICKFLGTSWFFADRNGSYKYYM